VASSEEGKRGGGELAWKERGTVGFLEGEKETKLAAPRKGARKSGSREKKKDMLTRKGEMH